MLPLGRARALGAAGGRLAAVWGRGARVGESAVCSLCVHLLTAEDADAVTVLADRDAGQVFYGRTRPGEIVHLDVFHTPGGVPPAAVATALRHALRDYRDDFPGRGLGISLDWFDLQTAVGGGRASGDLRDGRGRGVQAAHRGHVHLAARFGPADAALCFYLVAAVERCAAAVGLPPRKPLRVQTRTGGPLGRGRGEMADYAALTDSWLREPRPAQAPPPAAPAAGGEEGLLSAAARLAEEMGGVDAARTLLEAFARPSSLGAGRPPGWGAPRLRDAAAHLVQQGWLESAGPLWRLTPGGEALRATFGRRLREVELALRTAARRVAAATAHGVSGTDGVVGPSGRRRGARAAPPARGERLVELAVAETALAAATRAAGTRGDFRLRVRGCDLRLRRRVHPKRVDLLLLIDASASMEGGRMRAAKTLARHLLLTGRDRVGVMAFQERSAALAVPLTRNISAAERGLRQVVPAGLTPLGAGLAAARAYLRRAHARNPLLLLVTDGIPTVSGGGASPLEDALREADALCRSGIAICCIGLEPNERYLAELARRAGGRLQVVAELRPELLAAVARRERLRRMEAPAGR